MARANCRSPFDRVVQSWDNAKGDRTQRFLGAHNLESEGQDLFLLAVFRRKLEYPALKRAVREQQNRFKARVVLIEDKASGTQLIQ